MTLNLGTALPLLMPKAIAWAEMQSATIARTGYSLDGVLISVAKSVGVSRPELIRILEVEQLPFPDDPDLKQAAIAAGLLGPAMVGLTLGHGVLVCHGHVTMRLLSHEFRHVFQYEEAGSIAAFLPIYLRQIVEVGYHNAPFEADARAHERHAESEM